MKYRLSILVLLTVWSNGVGAQGWPGAAIDGLSAQSARKVLTSATAFAQGKARAGRAASDLGWDCLAAARLTELGLSGAGERLAGIAEQLRSDVVRSRASGRAIGWAASAGPGAACVTSSAPRANVSASCEAGDRTLYAFQAGLGMACMARAAAILKRTEYLDTASEVMAYWDRLRMHQTPCPECIFYATSDSSANEFRYVRNMNLFIAFGETELSAAARNRSMSEAARRAVQSDIVERSIGNRGYLGKLDPLWSSRPGEPERIENHAASMALLLNAMAMTLHDPEIERQALLTWKDWATCDNKRCRTAGCAYWAGDADKCLATATVAHCAFRFQDPLAKLQCEKYLNRVPSLGSYALYSVSQARLIERSPTSP